MEGQPSVQSRYQLGISLGWCFCWFSVAQSCLTLLPHELQHARLPYSSPSPRVCSNSCLLSQWCNPAISSSAAPFSSYPQSFPASRSLPKSRWRRKGQPTPVFLPGKSHGLRILVGYSPWGCKVRHGWATTTTKKRVGSLHQVVKVLELQLQYQSFHWIFRTDFL